jgi:hypothetical protein
MKNLARRAARVPAYLALLGMVACNGGHSSLPAAGVSSSSVTPVNGGAHVATSGVYGANLLSGASYVGPATLNSVGLDVWVQTSNDEGLRAYAKAANDPTSPLYRHWLTPQEIGARFGASQASYTRVAQYLNNYGMAVESFPQRQMLRVFGPQAGVEAALGMTLGVYKKGTQTFIAPTSTPKLPSALKIAGLTSIVTYRFRNRDMVPVRAANGLLQGYAPQQIANVFDYTGAAQAGFTGSGITIGIIGTGPITDNGSTPGDVSAFCFMFGRSCAPVSQVYSTNANRPIRRTTRRAIRKMAKRSSTRSRPRVSRPVPAFNSLSLTIRTSAIARERTRHRRPVRRPSVVRRRKSSASSSPTTRFKKRSGRTRPTSSR